MLRTPFGSPPRADDREQSAIRGASSDGFSTTVLPQTIAGNTFHAMLAMGVFTEMIRPPMPRGCRTVGWTCPGHAETSSERPCSRMPRRRSTRPAGSPPGLRPGHPAAACRSPVQRIPRVRRLATSSTIRCPASICPRLTGVCSDHPTAARPAALIAAPTSSRAESANCESTRPVCGSDLSVPCPVTRLVPPAFDPVGYALRALHRQMAVQPPSTTRFAPVM